MSRRRHAALIVAALTIAAPLGPGRAVGSAGEPVRAAGPVERDTTWEGRVVVEQLVTVGAAATLTILPGTEVRFAAAGGLTVNGVLRAEGSADKPILFVPDGEGRELWAGIVLGSGPAPSLLSYCRVERARTVGIGAGRPRIANCDISGGTVGISVGGDSTFAEIVGNRVHDHGEGGIQCSAGAAGVVADNDVERCGRRGISAYQAAEPEIRGNRVSACESGIELHQSAPRVLGNVVAGCERGIALTSVGGGAGIRSNRVEGNRVGILCQQFSEAQIAGNTIARNGDGIVCFMGAAPLIRDNDIVDNDRGIFCNQLSTPEITANTIAGNRRGVVLHLSSYARVHGNNITGGEVLMELMNMSADWERRAGSKPQRGLQQRNRGLAEQGRALLTPGIPDGLELEGAAVDAAGNWWGDEATREMEAKGPDANIGGLIDYYDVPTRTYEGFDGEFVQDRIVYAPWLKAPVAAAGAQAPVTPPAR